eukprot:g74934.t1
MGNQKLLSYRHSNRSELHSCAAETRKFWHLAATSRVGATKTNLFDCDLKYIDHDSSGQVTGGMVRKIPNPHGSTTSQVCFNIVD